VYFPNSYNIDDNHNIAFVVTGSQLYKTASETSDIDIKIVTLEDIHPLLNLGTKTEQIKFKNYELSKISLSKLVKGLIEGRINEVEIILSDQIIKGVPIITELKSIFGCHISDKQITTLLSNCLGVIQTCKSRKLEGKSCKPKSVINKCKFIYNYLEPRYPYQGDNIDELESIILAYKQEVGDKNKGTMENYNLETYSNKYNTLYKDILYREYVNYINNITV
jgi:hypothetical protein